MTAPRIPPRRSGAPPRLPGVTVSRPPVGLEDTELLRAERALAQRDEVDDEELRRAERALALQERDRSLDVPHTAAQPAREPAPDLLNKVTASRAAEEVAHVTRYESLPERDPIVTTAPAETDPLKVRAAKRAVAAAQGAPPVGQALAEMMSPEALTAPGRAPIVEEQRRFNPDKIRKAQADLGVMLEAAGARGDVPMMRHLQQLRGNVEAYLAAHEAQASFGGATIENLRATLGDTKVDETLARGAAELPEALATLGLTDDDGAPLSFASPFGAKQMLGMMASDVVTSVVGGKIARAALGGVAETADDVARAAQAGSRAARLAPKVAAAARATARFGTGAEIALEQRPLGEMVRTLRAARGLNPVAAGLAAATPGPSTVTSAMVTGLTQGQLTSTVRQVNQARAQGAPVLEPAVEGLLMGSALGPLGEFAGRGVAAAGRTVLNTPAMFRGHLEDLATAATAPPPSPESVVRTAFRAELRQPGKPGVVTWMQLQGMLADGLEPGAIVDRFSTAVTPEARAGQVAALEQWRASRVGDAPTPAALEPTPAVPVPQNPPRPWLLPQPPEQKLLTAGTPADPLGPAIPMRHVPAEEGRTPNAKALVDFERQLRDASARRAAAPPPPPPPPPSFREVLKRAQAQGLRHGVGPLALAESDDENLDPRARAMLQLGGLAMLAGSITAYHGSPHLFDAEPDAALGKFRWDRIGSGEGQQSYGYGHYIATNAEVAKQYIPEPHSLQWAKGFMGGKGVLAMADAAYTDLAEIDFGTPNAGRARTVDRVVDLLEEQIRDMEDPDDVEVARRAIKYLKQGDIVIPSKEGTLYRVDADVDDDNVIDLDKPVREQHPAVRAILERESGAAATDPSRLGSEVLWHMESLAPDGAEQVSEALRDAGIRGLKYLDEGSRARGGGTHNYVIFDDRFLKVTGRRAKGDADWVVREGSVPPVTAAIAAGAPDAQELAQVQRVFGARTPDDVAQRLVEGVALPEGTRAHVNFRGSADGVDATLRLERAGRPVGRVELRFGTEHARLEYAQVARALRGRRIGSSIAANGLILARELGARSASVASVGDGVAVWPKLGFQAGRLDLTDEATQRLRAWAGRASEAEVSHATPEAASEAHAAVAKHADEAWFHLSAGRPLTADERIAGMRFTERAKQGWYDVRGLKATRPEHLAEILRPLRSQKMERMHLVYVNGRGKILAHVMETSGLLNMVQFGRPGVGRDGEAAFRAWASEVEARGKRLGAKGLWMAHNHPSGIPTPSYDDKNFTAWVQHLMPGLPVKGHVVIDHATFDALKPDPTGKTVEVLTGGRIGRGDAGPDVTRRSQGVEGRPWGVAEEIARQARRMEARSAAQVVYLDTQNRIVAVEPHGDAAMNLPQFNKWLPQRMRGLGAGKVVVVTGDDFLAKQLEFRGQMPKGVADIIVDPNGGRVAEEGAEMLPVRSYRQRLVPGDAIVEYDAKRPPYAYIVREDPLAVQAQVERADAQRAEPGGIVPQEYHNAGRHAFTPGVTWTPEEAADLAARVQRVLRPIPEQDIVADALGGPLTVQHGGQGAYDGAVSPMTAYAFPPDAPFEQVATRAAAQQLLFGQDAGLALAFHGDELNLEGMSAAERVLRGDRIRRVGLAADLSSVEKDRMLQVLAADNIRASALEVAPGQWSVHTVDQQGLPELFDEAFAGVVDDIAPHARRFAGYAEVEYYGTPRAAAAALLRHRPGALRALAGLLDRVEPEYLASAERLGGSAALERTRARIAARRRGLLALADAVERPSPPALTDRGRLAVDEAHLRVAAQRNAAGAGPALRALDGDAYVTRLAEDFAREADAAIDQAVELTGDPNATTRWYGATVRHAEDIAATFGLPEIVGRPDLAFLFHTVSSILSNGQAVFREYLSAIPVMQQYLRTGKLTMLLPEAADLPADAVRDVTRRTGPFRGAGAEGPIPLSHRWRSHEAGLKRLQKLLDERGLEGAMAYLGDDQVLSPTGKVRTKTVPATGEKRPVSPTVYEFGIKVGQYVRDKLGLSKASTDGVTVDVWMHRLERMLRGEGPPTKGPTQAETLRIQAATERARQMLEAKHPGIAARDIQAALWERAKMLYRDAGAREMPGAYDTLADAGRQWAGGAGQIERDPAQVALMQRYLPHAALPAGFAIGLDDEDEMRFDARVALEGLAIALLAHGVGTAAERALGVGAATELAKRFGSTASLVAAGSLLAGSEDPDVSRYGAGMALALAGLHALGTSPYKVAGKEVLAFTRRMAAESPAMAKTFAWFSPSLVLSDESLAALTQARRTLTKGRTIGAGLAARAAKAGAAADRFASDVVEGEAWENAAALSPEARQAALEVAARYQEVMREVMAREIALGTIPDEVVAKLPHDRYLPRVYAEHLGDDVLAPTESEYTHGRALTVHGPRRRVLDVPVYEAMDDLEAMERALDFATTRGDPVQVDGARLARDEAQQRLAEAMRRRDASRLALGEVREFSWRAPAAVEDAFGRVAAGELLSTLKATGDVHPEWLAAAAARDAAAQVYETALDKPAREALRERLAAAEARLAEVRRQLPEASLEAAETVPANPQRGPEGRRLQWLAEYEAARDEVTDLRAAIATAGDEAQRQAARQQVDVANTILRDLGQRLEVDGQSQWAQLPSTAGYGPLAGAIVKRAVADELRGVADPAAWGAFMRFWKQAKTKYNPGTHVGNTASNVVMLHMAGLSWWQQPAYIQRALSDLRSGGPMSETLRQAGVLGQAELALGTPRRASARTPRQARALRASTRPETAAALEKAGVEMPTRGDRVRNVGSAIHEKVSGAYQAEDDLFRIAAFDFARRTKGLDDAAAAEWSRQALGDFSRGQSSRAVRLARNTGAPFIAYPLAALPTFAQHVIERPWRWVALTAPLLFLNEWGQAEAKHDLGPADVAPRERDGVFGLLLPNLVQVPMSRDDRDRVPAMDLSRWTPLSALVTGAPPATLGGAIDAPQILQPTGPLVDVPAMMLNRESAFSDRKLVDPMAPTGEKAATVGRAVGDLLLPSAAGYSLRRLITDTRRKDPQGVTLDVMGYAGIRPRYYGKGDDAMRARNDLEKRMRDIDYQARMDLKNARRAPGLKAEIMAQRDRRRAAAKQQYEDRTAGR